MREAVRVPFFTEEFTADPLSRSVIQKDGRPAKDFVTILVLHYLQKKLEGLAPLTGVWISFKELESGEQYYPAFRKRSIDLILKKYSSDPSPLEGAAGRLPGGRKGGQGDYSVIADSFPGVPIQVVLWKGDDEFAAEANILFDSSIGAIFCTEDVAVLAGFTAKYF
ncbi:MAG: DUF3786 domain-containing protein [Deltaproteobacteria bacterium]